MKKHIVQFIKNQWLFLWILLISFGMVALVVSAEYPGKNNFMKRVVMSDESSDMMFSSNLLTLVENDRISYRPYFVRQLENSSETYNVDVFVWNYDIDGTGDFYSKQINYDLEIKVVDEYGNTLSNLGNDKSIQVFKNGSITPLVTFSDLEAVYTYNSSEQETLASGGRTQNTYSVRFSGNWDLRNDTGKRVMIKATPAAAFTDLKTLAAAIGLKEERASASTGWKYYINEQRLDNSATPVDCDAYNLVLTGTGSQTITIEWNPAVAALNQYFYESGGSAFPFVSGEVVYTAGGGTNGWNKLVINADSYSAAKNYRNRYDIQIYKVNGELGNSWGFISSEQSTGVCITIDIPTDTGD